MQQTVLEPRYTPAAAADLAGVGRVALQRWCDRAAFVVARADNPAGWRRYALWDVARLAIVEALRGYGLTVAGAADVVDTELGWRVTNLAATGHGDPDTVAAALRNTALVVYRSDGPHGVGWDTVDTVPVDADPRVADLTSYVVVRVGPIVRHVFDAAAAGARRKPVDTELERRARRKQDAF